MSHTTSYIDRLDLKTSEGEFLYELQNSYELSFKLSEQILQTAKTCLLRDNTLLCGQVEYHAISLDSKSGKPLSVSCLHKIHLTLNSPQDDLEVLSSFGRSALRRSKIHRFCSEALEQNCILSQEDLSFLLGVDVRTIKRDFSYFRKMGISVITRGVYHNIGRGQTHKVQIINMYLDGLTYSEIQRKTRHSIGAIKRYLDCFGKVLMCHEHEILDPSEIQSVTGLSKYLIMQYESIISAAKSIKERSNTLDILRKQLSYLYGSKKTIVRDGLKVEVMTGDLK